jgi:ATP-binding cassette subfamily B protein
MSYKESMQKNSRFYRSICLNVLEGGLSGCNFIVLYGVVGLLWQQNTGYTQVLRLTFIVASIFLLRLIIYGVGYTDGQVGGAQISRNIRMYLGHKLRKIPLGTFNQIDTGDVINVATSDVNNYENILTHKLGDIIKNISLMVMVITYLMSLHRLSGLTLLVSFLLLGPSLWLSFKCVRYFGHKKSAICIENVSNMTEYIQGIQTMRAYGYAGNKNKDLIASMSAYSDVSYRYELAVIPVGILYNGLQWLCFPIIIYIAGQTWLNGGLDVTKFIMISLMPLFVCKLNSTLFIDLTAFKNLMISKGRILDMMQEEEGQKTDEALDVNSYDIEFKGVSFAYDEERPVLKDMSFKAANKKLTAIVGPSGSGKSTIFNLIAKYYEPNKGQIHIGGQDISDLQAESVLKKIAQVDQDIFLFNESIGQNIRYANQSVSDEDMVKACKKANCHDFIMSLDQGYDTLIGENGNKLSGGERQRLSIGRALLKDSPILLLDEATASLDIENELKVKEGIKSLLETEKTVLMIAHTLSVIKEAHHIVVIEDGRLIEEGTHEALMALKSKYYHMWMAERKMH